MKTGRILLLSFMIVSAPLKATDKDFGSFTHKIKEGCVQLFPATWQNQIRKWFWPGAASVAVLCVSVGLLIKKSFFTTEDIRTIYMQMAHELMHADPLVSQRKTQGIYGFSTYIFQDGSGGTMHFLKNDKQFDAYIFKFPVDIDLLIADVISKAMRTLGK